MLQQPVRITLARFRKIDDPTGDVLRDRIAGIEHAKRSKRPIVRNLHDLEIFRLKGEALAIGAAGKPLDMSIDSQNMHSPAVFRSAISHSVAAAGVGFSQSTEPP